MALDAHHALLLGKGEKFVLEVFLAGSHHEAHVHQGAVFLGGRAHKEAVAVDFVIQEFRLLLVDFLDGFHAADALEPFEGLVHHVDGEHGRGVEHGEFVDMGLVVEHGGDVTGHTAQGTLTDDGEDDAGRAHVLLGAAVDEVIFAHVHRTGHDVGGHVGDQRAGAVDVLVDLRSVNGVVGGDVEIVQVGRDFESLGDVGVVLVLGAGDGIGLADALGLYEGFVGPDAGVQIGGLLLQVVHGYIEELQGGTAAEEHDFVGVRNVEKFLPQGAAFIHHGVPLLGAVADGEDGNSGSAEVFEGFDGMVDGNLRQQARAGIENMNFFGHGYGWLVKK